MGSRTRILQTHNRFAARIVRASLLATAVMLPGVVPSIGLRSLAEHETSLDQAESSEEPVTRSQSKLKLRWHQLHLWVMVAEPRTAFRLLTGDRDCEALAAHRLSGNLMAPLRL